MTYDCASCVYRGPIADEADKRCPNCGKETLNEYASNQDPSDTYTRVTTGGGSGGIVKKGGATMIVCRRGV